MSNYYLLPFRFERLDNNEILVNEAGDYLIAPSGTAQRIVSRDIQSQEELYKDLTANFFISKEQVPRLLDNWAIRYRTKKSFLDTFTSLHIFVMTLRCNQNCRYCHASSRSCDAPHADMTTRDMKRAIELMFSSPSPSITMEFQGGEPTLVAEDIYAAVEMTEELNKTYRKHITYVLCTNSVDLSDELLQFCNTHHVLISTSLDGPESIHNKNRGKSNSYKQVVDGIEKARSVLGQENISALMTTSDLSLNYPREIIDSYLENGFNHIFLRALNPYGLAAANEWGAYTDRFIQFYKEALDYILKLNMQGTYFVEDHTALILKKILTPFCIGFVDLQSPAGLINSVIVYNYDGYVYASDESRMLSEYNDYTFRLGHVSEPYSQLFYGPKTGKIAQVWANEALAGCADCAFQAYCGADPVRNYATQGDMYGFRPSSSFCKKNKAMITHIFSLLINRPDVISIFKSWINVF